MRLSANRERNLLDDFEPISFKGHDAARMVRQHTDAAQTEIDQNLSADSALALDDSLRAWILLAGFARVETNRRKSRAFGGLRIDFEAAAALMQIDKNAAILFGDSRKRLVDGGPAITGRRGEYVTREAMGMNANQRGRAG